VIRRVLIVASALSLVLGAALAVLWIISYWRIVEVSYNCPTPPTYSVTGFWLSVNIQQGAITAEWPHTELLGFPCFLPAVLLAILPSITAIGMARRRLRAKATRGFSVEPIPHPYDTPSN
jgi:hypothetical protein